MNAALRDVVRRRARMRCEYCMFPERYAATVPFQIEHVIARQHRGATIPSNLALACHRCNLSKGPNLSGVDPVSKRIVSLFHPRRMKWARHFRWEGPFLIGRTDVGRTTIEVLDMNDEERVDLRQGLIQEGIFPQS